jgi:hypothetical protein
MHTTRKQAGVIFNRSNAAIREQAAEVGDQSSLIEADEIELMTSTRDFDRVPMHAGYER